MEHVTEFPAICEHATTFPAICPNNSSRLRTRVDPIVPSQTTHGLLPALITTESLTDREFLNFRDQFSAPRWNNLSDMPITASTTCQFCCPTSTAFMGAKGKDCIRGSRYYTADCDSPAGQGGAHSLPQHKLRYIGLRYKVEAKGGAHVPIRQKLPGACRSLLSREGNWPHQKVVECRGLDCSLHGHKVSVPLVHSGAGESGPDRLQSLKASAGRCDFTRFQRGALLANRWTNQTNYHVP